MDVTRILLAMRRALVALALLGLALAPVASFSHELSHAFGDPASHKLPDRGKTACELCAAYAGIGHALASCPALELPIGVAPRSFPATPETTAAARIAAYHPRAPPTASTK
jgi:hypothetical protein